MAVLPESRTELITFIEVRLPAWTAAGAAIGLSVPQLTDLATVTNAARTALDAQIDAINIKLAATSTMHTQTDALRALAGDLVKVIRTQAELTNDPLVYDLAQIPAPQPPTPAGPPVQPTELEARVLLPYGIGIKWKGSVSQGTYFGVYRKVAGETSFSLIATSKTKNYEDISLPAGITSVQYYIAAIRDEFTVNSAGLTVQFGPGGTMTMALAA
jgi:hypothetical protein